MSSTLKDLLKDRRSAIAERWVKSALEIYARDAATLFNREKDPFANPVGHALRTGSEAVLEGLAAGTDVEALGQALADIVRMRAVQEVSPSKSVAFVFLLKDAVRAELGSRRSEADVSGELAKLDALIDRLALVAFDFYVQARERVCELRINEVKRSVSAVMERMNRRPPNPAPASDRPDEDIRAT